MTKQERCNIVNQLIKTISSYGRRFFYYNGKDGNGERIARIEIINGRLYFYDDYTQQKIAIIDNRPWKNFSHGGTLKALILHFADYIRTGNPINPRYFGPEMSYGNVWGYPEEDMNKVRKEALDILLTSRN